MKKIASSFTLQYRLAWVLPLLAVWAISGCTTSTPAPLVEAPSYEVGQKVAQGDVAYCTYLGTTQQGYQMQAFYQGSNQKLTDPFVVTQVQDIPRCVFTHGAFMNGLYITPRMMSPQIPMDTLVTQDDVPFDLHLQGMLTQWYDNGAMAMQGQFHNGVQQGLTTTWYSNGAKEREGHYIDGLKEGQWTSWYAGGEKSLEGNYVHDQEDGLWTGWYENGQKSEEGSYQAGQKEGVWRKWWDNGQLSDETHFLKGQLHGTWRQWYVNGDRALVGQHQNGRVHGQLQVWYGNGQRWVVGQFDQGRGELTIWHENGQKSQHGHIVDGIPVGLWQRWDEQGKLLETVTYEPIQP